MRLIVCLALMLLSLSPLCSQDSPYRTEFGIDLILPLIIASGNTPESADLEIIYRENDIKGDLRFKFIIRSFTNQYEFIERTIIDTIKFFNYYNPRLSYGVDIGFSKNLYKKNMAFYVGTDFHFAYNVGAVTVYREPCNFSLQTAINCEYDRSISNRNFTVGLIPFLGTRVQLSERLFFSIEFGPSLNYHFGKRKLPGENGIMERAFSQLDMQFNKLLNDFAVLYRF